MSPDQLASLRDRVKASWPHPYPDDLRALIALIDTVERVEALAEEWTRQAHPATKTGVLATALRRALAGDGGDRS